MISGPRRLTLIALAGLALGMESAPRAAMATSPVPARSDQPDEQRLLDIDFPGGTLGDYFDLVAQKADSNIVARADVRALEMPPVRLRLVTTTTAVELVSSLFDNTMTGQVLLNYVNAGEPISTYVATLVRDVPEPEPVVVNEVFSIGDVLRPADEEAVEGQVRRIFEMIDSAMDITFSNGRRPERPELAFHDETQMLLFRGTPEQREMIEAVLARYLNSWEPQHERAQQLVDLIADDEYQLRHARIEQDAAAMRRDVAHQAHARLETAYGVGQANESELAESKSILAQADAVWAIATVEVQQLESRLEARRLELSHLSAGDGTDLIVYDFRDLGPDGERIGMAFGELLKAANLPETSLDPNGEGLVALRAAAPLHEALRYLLNQARQANQAREPGGR